MKHKKYEIEGWEEKTERFSIRMEPSVKNKILKMAEDRFEGNMSMMMIELIKNAKEDEE